MTLIELPKKIIKRLTFIFLNRFFYQEPRSLLRLLYRWNLDIPLFAIPYFYIANFSNLKKLKRLKASGKSPAIIYFAVENDGRFDRLYEMSKAADVDNSVWFCFPRECISTEAIIFESFARRKSDFYEDARMKYIEPGNDENRARYRQYLNRFFPAFERLTGKIDFFMSGSNHDRYVVEMVAVAQSRGIEWIVAEREGTGTKFSYKNEAECYKQSKCVTADYFFTANAGHKYMFDHSRQASVKEVSVVGELDTDWWFHWDRSFSRRQYREWDKYERRVLFLTFGIRNYVESYAFPDNPEFNWQRLLTEAEDSVFEFASKHRDVLVFYKMGHIEDNNPLFIARCAKAGLTNIVPLDRSFPCNELILYSQLIIGFQSTATFESMFSDAPIFYLDWAIPEGIDREEMLLPIADLGACTPIKSQAHFDEMLNKWEQGDASIISISPEMKDCLLYTSPSPRD